VESDSDDDGGKRSHTTPDIGTFLGMPGVMGDGRPMHKAGMTQELHTLLAGHSRSRSRSRPMPAPPTAADRDDDNPRYKSAQRFGVAIDAPHNVVAVVDPSDASLTLVIPVILNIVRVQRTPRLVALLRLFLRNLSSLFFLHPRTHVAPASLGGSVRPVDTDVEFDIVDTNSARPEVVRVFYYRDNGGGGDDDTLVEQHVPVTAYTGRLNLGVAYLWPNTMHKHDEFI
jgi:hypothetical protein